MSATVQIPYYSDDHERACECGCGQPDADTLAAMLSPLDTLGGAA